MINNNNSRYIIAYGSWAPGDSKHHVFDDLPGAWRKGKILAGQNSTGDKIQRGEDKTIEAWLLEISDGTLKMYSEEWGKEKELLKERWLSLDKKMGPTLLRRMRSWWPENAEPIRGKNGQLHVNIYLPLSTFPDPRMKNDIQVREYVIYLFDLIGYKKDIDEYTELHEQFYGFFDAFRPDGKGLEKVFEPIPDSEEYLIRLKKVYQATADNLHSDNGKRYAYFIPKVKTEEQKLRILGERHLANLKKLAKVMNNPQVINAFDSVKSIDVINEKREKEQGRYDEIESILHDNVGDYMMENWRGSKLIGVLGEAYYSIAADYLVARYLQHPGYQHKLDFDVFEPYFELWQAGYKCFFEREVLIICQ